MTSEALAVHGGPKAIDFTPSLFSWFDTSDIEDVKNLLTSQRLSGFLAQPGSPSLGGQNVLELEKLFSEKYQTKHAISFNSWTSGLEAIFIALDLPFNSEVILPSWTMSATAASIALANLNPVFCDIDKETFNLDPEKVLKLITPKTRAICVVDIFGQPADWPEFRRIADRYNLILVSDSAQTPLANVHELSPLNFADVGGFSFNRHKHLQTGEGGVVLTNKNHYSERLRAIRNHGEVSAPEVKLKHRELYGHNWRLGEVEAILARKQLLKLPSMVEERRNTAHYFIDELRQLRGLRLPTRLPYAEHDYYILGLHFDASKVGFSRDYAVQSLKAEGVDFVIGTYCELHNVAAYRNFRTGDLSVTNCLNRSEFLGLYICGYNFDKRLREATIHAFTKVWQNSTS